MKNWQRTKVQFLSNLYAHMKERISNPAKSVAGRKYLGLKICSLEEFLIFGLTDKTFHLLYIKYRRSQGKRKFVPSIDRIEGNKGYLIDNLQFMTVGENSSKESKTKWLILQNTKTKRMSRFSSTSAAGKFLHHKREIKVSRKAFYDVKTKVKYLNKSKRKYK